MLNFGLIQKILEISGEKPENIDRVMVKIAHAINDKYEYALLDYLERNATEEQLEKLEGFIKRINVMNNEERQEVQKWFSENSSLDYDEFMTEFEKLMEEFEMKLIDAARPTLDDNQIKQLIDFIQEQIDATNKAADDVVKAFDQEPV